MNKTTSVLSAGRPSARAEKAATLASLADDAGVTKRITFELAPEQHAKLKIYAARQGTSIKELLTKYIAELPE
jgi:hypothetical protein